MATSASPKSNILNSWKEIADYLGRGVRTVQRWERDLGMPVRRPRAKSRSAVVALQEEIDAWLRAAPAQELNHPTSTLRRAENSVLKASIEVSHLLRQRCQSLRNEHHQALTHLMDKLGAIEVSVRTTEGSNGRQRTDGSGQGKLLKN